MDIDLVRTTYGLRAYGDEDFDKLRRIKEGAVVKVSLTKPRNPLFHRKFFAMLHAAYDLLTEQQRENVRSEDGFRQMLLITAGFTEKVYNLQGEVFSEKAKSISFGKMDEYEFNKVYSRVLDTILAILSANGVTEEIFNDILRNYG